MTPPRAPTHLGILVTVLRPRWQPIAAAAYHPLIASLPGAPAAMTDG